MLTFILSISLHCHLVQPTPTTDLHFKQPVAQNPIDIKNISTRWTQIIVSLEVISSGGLQMDTVQFLLQTLSILKIAESSTRKQQDKHLHAMRTQLFK